MVQSRATTKAALEKIAGRRRCPHRQVRRSGCSNCWRQAWKEPHEAERETSLSRSWIATTCGWPSSKALRGKRDRREARQFVATPGRATWTEMARATLRAGDLSPRPLSAIRRSTIPRNGSSRLLALPERVLHHAIMNVCEPILDRWLIDDTYACRKGKGRLAALQRAQQFAGRFRVLPQAGHPEILRQHPARPVAGSGWRGVSRIVRLLELFGRIVRLVPRFAGPRPADRQPDLAALRQLLPGLVRPLRQGDAAGRRATSATWTTCALWSDDPRELAGRPWRPARPSCARNWAWS